MTGKSPHPFDTPLTSNRPQTARIARKGRHAAKGQYIQVTFRLPADFKAVIEEVAASAGISQEDAKRWLVAEGIRAYREGARPDTVSTAQNRLATGALDVR